MSFFVKHRTAQEISGSGYKPPNEPWKYEGPFTTQAEAQIVWNQLRPNWQEGCIVSKCDHCGSYVEVK